MISVKLPDGSVAQFPDGTSPDLMKAAIQKKFPPDNPPTGATPGGPAYKEWAIARAKAGKTLPQVGPVPPEQDAMHSGPVANASAGLNDVIATTFGAPVDLVRTAINASTQPNSMEGAVARNLPFVGPLINATQTLSSAAKVPAVPDTAIGGRRSIIGAMQMAGITDPDTVNARTMVDRIVRASAGGAAAMIAPEAMIGLLGKAGIVGPEAAQIMSQMFGKSETTSQLIGNTLAGAASGAGSEAAAEVAPDNLKPLARAIGGLGGAGTGTLVTGVPRLASAATQMTKDFAAPLSEAGRQQMVGSQLREATTNPSDAVRAIETTRPLVPGSMPTTGQLTGDMGLLGLERAAQTKDPIPFQERRAQQNSARVNALESLQPGSSPDQVVGAVRSYLSDIDTQLTQSLDAARGNAQTANGALGAGSAPDLAGADMRTALEGARADAKTAERQLWRAVDPTGTLALGTDQTRSQARSIADAIPTTAKPQSAEEQGIFHAATSLPATARLSELTALQSRIKEEMRAERLTNGESAAWRRLSMLNGAVQNDLEGAISSRVAQDQQAVAAGRMQSEDTIAAKLQNEVRSFFNARNAATGEIGGEGIGGATRRGPAGIPRSNGAEVPLAGRFGNAQGDQGLSGNGVADEGAFQRLSAARQATANRVATFDNRTLAPLRQRPSTTSPYNVTDAGVAQRIFHAGPQSFDHIQTYRAAVGDQRAIPLLENYAIDRLRQSALRDDGTLDPARLATFRRSHADALRALPDLNARIGDAEVASNALGDAAQVHNDVLDAAQAGALGRIVGAHDGPEVTRLVGSIFDRADSAHQMFRLRTAIGTNQAAREGLRKAVVDHMMNRFVGNTEAATSGVGTIKSDQFQTFVSRNRPALEAAGFSKPELDAMDNIAADVRNSNRSLNAVRIPGQSNTAQDVLAARPGMSAPHTILHVLLATIPGAGGYLAGGLTAGLAGAVLAPIATTTIQILRQNGIKQADELLRSALLDPQLAKTLMLKATPGNMRLANASLAARFRRAAVTNAVMDTKSNQRQMALQ